MAVYPTSACKECCMDPAAEDDGCVPTQIDKAAGQPCLLGICDKDYVKYRGRKRRRLTLMPKFRRDGKQSSCTQLTTHPHGNKQDRITDNHHRLKHRFIGQKHHLTGQKQDLMDSHPERQVLTDSHRSVKQQVHVDNHHSVKQQVHMDKHCSVKQQVHRDSHRSVKQQVHMDNHHSVKQQVHMDNHHSVKQQVHMDKHCNIKQQVHTDNHRSLKQHIGHHSQYQHVLTFLDSRHSVKQQLVLDSHHILNQKNFHLVLYPGSPVLAPGFQAKTVDRFGRKRPFYINPNEFFMGHLAGDSSVSVEAHFENGILSSTITFPNETYAVEPAWRHLPPSDNHTMIAYRGSDVKWDELYPTDKTGRKRTRLSDGIRLDQENTTSLYLDEHLRQSHEKRRQKRAAGGKNLCPLLVVADYSFFEDVGVTREGTALYIIGVLNRVNERYKKTEWSAGLTGFGFQIKEMLIHDEYSDTPGHYNEKTGQWEIRQKLDSSYGLLAASALLVSTDSNKFVTYICNITNIGHNWGAEHDPDTAECAPSSYQKGKYIMWPYAVTGWEDNNHIFSPCSKRWIAPVLESKADLCFTEEVDPLSTTPSTVSVDGREEKHDKGTGLCGNGLIDKDEECDAGFLGNKQEDPCCTSDCKLKPGATCRGKCFDGRCLNFCETRGREQNIKLKPCLCDQNSTAACSFCCMQINENGTYGSCEPTEEKLGDGRTCGFGYCEAGACVAMETNLVQRIFRFFTTVDISDLVLFMKTNIVGTVIVFSLVIWVPASWIFSCITSFVPPEFKEFRIKNSRITRVPPPGVNGAAAVRHQDDPQINSERFGRAPLAEAESSF
ncbi:hypothetical protein BaRGS_00017894 [Batillaria attramentaria]|uniref:Uncharacterized protein n=1 Tax=Batillaria attramentaria TaxID=370345 RepID=A0ABD0KU81_9CAEN